MPKKRHHIRRQRYLVGILAIGLLAVGFLVLRQRTKPTEQLPSNAQQSPSSSTELPSLDNGNVTFRAPKDWIVQDYEGCHESLDSNSAGCVDARALVPLDKPRTVFFNDLENDVYAVFIKVFPAQNRSAQSWFTNVYNNSEPETQRHTTQTISIQGQKVYVYKSSMIRPTYSRNGYDNINYVFGKNDKIVIVTAVLAEYGYTQGKLQSGNHADFTQYLPDIESIASSITLK